MPHVRQTTKNAAIDTAFLDRLLANRDRIAGNGDDPSSDAFWHKNALMVVAGVLGQAGKAAAALSQASLVLAAAITDTLPSGAVDLSLAHADGSTATLRIVVSPGEEAGPLPEPSASPDRPSTSAAPTPQDSPECVWVSLSSLQPSAFPSLVEQLARQAGLKPGSLDMDIATGAVLALVQACDAASTGAFSSRLDGFGDDASRVGVAIDARVDHPQPTPHIAPPRPPRH